jgi:hypothetical protein
VTVTDFLDEKRKEITSRLSELKPIVDEYRRLEAAASALDGVGGSTRTATAAPRRRGPGTPARFIGSQHSSSEHGGAGKNDAQKVGRPRDTAKNRVVPFEGPTGRRKGSGQRGTEALALIQGLGHRDP